MQTAKARSSFRKTAEPFADGSKTVAQDCFVSPKVFAEEPAFATATPKAFASKAARQARK